MAFKGPQICLYLIWRPVRETFLPLPHSLGMKNLNQRTKYPIPNKTYQIFPFFFSDISNKLTIYFIELKGFKMLENSYLEHISIFLKSGNENKHLLRTFIDDWFAYSTGGPFLNKNGKPKWFNKPDPIKDKDALLQMHFISNQAKHVIKNKYDTRLIKEHSVPVAVIYDILRREANPSSKMVKNILLKYYRLGVLTKIEDEKLSRRGFKSSMPPNWSLDDDVFARYNEAGIV